MIPEKDTTLQTDWAEYHSTYTFKDGTFKAERRLTIRSERFRSPIGTNISPSDAPSTQMKFKQLSS